MSGGLEGLINKYPSALYVFFRIVNYTEARRLFLAGETAEPDFRYADSLTQEAVAQRLQSLHAEELDDPLAAAFVHRRLQESSLLQTFLRLRDDPASNEQYQQYRSLMIELYGSFEPALLSGVVGYLENRATARGKVQEWQALCQAMGQHTAATVLYRPSAATFSYYRALLKADPFAAEVMHTRPQGLSQQEVAQYFTWALGLLDAPSRGWTVRQWGDGVNVMISRQGKTVLIGGRYVPGSAARLQQIVLHEVGIHVRRTLMRADVSPFANDEEGVAILVEQLLANRFIYRRLLRYFAAALAWGADGKPRTFREVFHIVWPAAMIVGHHTAEAAANLAFGECARVFRGGIPARAGAAFCKDKIYLEHNLTIWEQLEDNKLDERKFLTFLYGKH